MVKYNLPPDTRKNDPVSIVRKSDYGTVIQMNVCPKLENWTNSDFDKWSTDMFEPLMRILGSKYDAYKFHAESNGTNILDDDWVNIRYYTLAAAQWTYAGISLSNNSRAFSTSFGLIQSE